MSINFKKYDRYNADWKTNPYYDCVVKFLLKPTPELLEFHRRVHNCRVAVNRYVYKQLVKKQALPKRYSELINEEDYPEIIRLLNKYNFILSNHRRGIAYSCYDPYIAYNSRGGGKHKIPKRTANLKEWGAIRFKETGGLIKDLNSKDRKGTIQIVTGGKGKATKVLETTYEIPKRMMPTKPLIKTGGNLVPPKNRQDKKRWVLGLRAEKPFKWEYQPTGAFGFDIGQRNDAFIAFSDGTIWDRPGNACEIIANIKELNALIDNHEKVNSTSKQRKKLRIQWQKTHDLFRDEMSLLVDDIIDMLDGRLLCIDDVSSGAQSGEFGQAITDMLIEKMSRSGYPYVEVPPYHTSQRCTRCGCIDPDNRPKEDGIYDAFKCVDCGYKANADVNAAQNIALFGQYIWDFGVRAFWKEKKSGRHVFVDQIKSDSSQPCYAF
jgi:hypothetical protein